jgi:hypothetical protein
VGSALVNRVEALADSPDDIAAEVSAILAGMRQAMDG